MMSLSKAEPDREDTAGKSPGTEARIPTGAQTEVRHSNGEAPAATSVTKLSRGSRKKSRSRSRRVDEGKAGLDAPDAAEAVVEGGSALTNNGESHHHRVAFVKDGETKTGASTLPEANAEASANGEGDKHHDAQIAIVKQKSSRTKEISTPKPIYLQDVNFAGLAGVATAADILVKQARTRVRVSRLKEGHVKGRHTEPHEKTDQKRLTLTIRMMLGVRVAVGRQSNPLERQEVVDEDFHQVDKYTFPPAGTSGRLATPSHQLNKTFKFRDYAPKVFKKLRAHFGIEESSYMLSVAGDYDYLELITNSKSGSFFFYSHDQRYIIKAMKASEAKFFRKILEKYYNHHLSHPDSLLIQFCGMYMVKNRHRRIPFIVMKCVEGDTDKEIHAKFDLKGSSLGRLAKEGEKVLKDLDLVKHGKIHLGSQRTAFLKSAKEDAEFLASVNVMDYSMLTVIHDSSLVNNGDSRPPVLERRYSNFYTFADEALDRVTPQFERLPQSSDLDAESQSRRNEAPRTKPTPPPVARAPLVRQASTLHFRGDGGVESDVNGCRGKDIYFMGIIDILQQYTTKKHAETLWKSMSHERQEISCVHPKLYCDRFIEFLTENSD